MQIKILIESIMVASKVKNNKIIMVEKTEKPLATLLIMPTTIMIAGIIIEEGLNTYVILSPKILNLYSPYLTPYLLNSTI